MNKEYEFTVFSPCYNSERFIRRTYESLKNQAFKNFEWLVIDDCSSDRTLNILNELKQESEIKINVVKNNSNKMLAYNCNLAVTLAKGKFFIFLGHDDELVPLALKRFYEVWKNIPSNEKNNLVGMMSNCQDEQGFFVHDELPEPPVITDFFNMYHNFGVKGEKCFCYLTEIIHKQNFSKVDKYVPENVFLMNISDQYSTYFFNENLRIYHTKHESFSNSLHAQDRIRYPIGMRYEKLQDLNRRAKKLKQHPILFVKTIINFIRFTFHSDILVRHSLQEISSTTIKIVAIFLLPVSRLLYFNDKIKLKLSTND
jgi:glycosyltransferase involved in cell wall biosynthesis|tara:strand:- start:751 stop:1689 length:939 start_codon:yes stop_codon:yes gene_type:complete